MDTVFARIIMLKIRMDIVKKEGEKKSSSDENDRFLTSCHFIIYIHATNTRAHILASVSAISARIYKMI